MLLSALTIISLATGQKGAGSEKSGGIALPDDPIPAVPYIEPSDTLNRDLNEKRTINNANKPTPEEQKKVVEQKIEKQQQLDKNRKLVEESLQDKPQVMQLSASLLLPSVTTTGKDWNYMTVEPTVALELSIAPIPSQQPDKTRFWTGLRYVSFYGSMSYKKTPGRYGFSYFGPMVGVGKFSSAPKVASPTALNEVNGAAEFHKSGFMWMSGVAAISREVDFNDGITPKGTEVNRTKGVAIDAPGLWSEFSYISLDYNARSTNYTIGVGAGKQKLYLYIGLGMGFWY